MLSVSITLNPATTAVPEASEAVEEAVVEVEVVSVVVSEVGVVVEEDVEEEASVEDVEVELHSSKGKELHSKPCFSGNPRD